MPDVKESLPTPCVMPDAVPASVAHGGDAHDHEEHQHGFALRMEYESF